MPENPNDMYGRLIKDRHQQAKDELQNLVHGISKRTSVDALAALASSANRKLRAIADVMPESPNWVRVLQPLLSNMRSSNGPSSFLDNYIELYPSILAPIVIFDSDYTPVIVADLINDKFSELNITKQFEAIVDLLLRLASHESLIPARALKSLNNLIVTIKANSSDFQSASSTLPLVKSLVNGGFANFVKERLGLDKLIDDISKACDEADVTLSRLPGAVVAELMTTFKDEFLLDQKYTILEPFSDGEPFQGKLNLVDKTQENDQGCT